jgi:cytoskeletal protein RodZ
MSRSRSSRRRKVLGVAALVVAVVGVGGATMALRAQDTQTPAAATSTSASPSASSTTVPAAAPSSTPVNPPPDPEDVATDTVHADEAGVQITYAGFDATSGGVIVGSVVTGLIEDGGTCSVVLSQGQRSAHAESAATADASSTSCGQMLVPESALNPGSWTATVSYASPAGQVRGTATTTVDVP